MNYTTRHSKFLFLLNGIGRNWIIVSISVTCPMLMLVFPGCKGSGNANKGDNAKSTASTDKDANQGGESSSSDSIGQWASDTWNGAVSDGTRTAQQTGQWISDMFNSARDRGITSANNVKDWVADDWNAQGDWRYKILQLDSSDVESMQQLLNEQGSNRWECFHVDTGNPTRWTFFLKQSRRSYLSQVPLKDLMNFLPTGSGEDAGQ